MWKVLIWRGVFICFGVSLWFYAMARIPIADVTAMNYLSPIYVTLGAALFLGIKRRCSGWPCDDCFDWSHHHFASGFEIGDGHIAMLLCCSLFWRILSFSETGKRYGRSVRCGAHVVLDCTDWIGPCCDRRLDAP